MLSPQRTPALGKQVLFELTPNPGATGDRLVLLGKDQTGPQPCTQWGGLAPGEGPTCSGTLLSRKLVPSGPEPSHVML